MSHLFHEVSFSHLIQLALYNPESCISRDFFLLFIIFCFKWFVLFLLFGLIP